MHEGWERCHFLPSILVFSKTISAVRWMRQTGLASVIKYLLNSPVCSNPGLIKYNSSYDLTSQIHLWISYCHSNLVRKVTLDSWLLAAFICSYCCPWWLAVDFLFGLCSPGRLRFSLWVQLDLCLAVGLSRSAPQNWFCLHWKSCAHGDGRAWNANWALKHTAHVCCAPSVNVPQTKASHTTELNSSGSGPWLPPMKVGGEGWRFWTIISTVCLQEWYSGHSGMSLLIPKYFNKWDMGAWFLWN